MLLLAISGTCCAQWVGREITRHTPTDTHQMLGTKIMATAVERAVS